jgi:hypothetical protein
MGMTVNEDLKMFNETNRTSGKALQHMYEVVQIHFDPQQVFQTPMTRRLSDNADLGNNDTANEFGVLLGRTADACERAVQALRDVRHLLPPEGVAIVDAVLDCAT